jgi:cytochrome oxidase Cu insertion factor (SCO1/SenC/PrrC family)
MGGMNSGLSNNDPTIVSAFHTALLHQGLIVVGLLLIVSAAWTALRSMQLRRALAGRVLPPAAAEPAARRLLRIGFGLLWIFDGILQGQASMPLGMVPDGIQPSASASPGWVQHVVNTGTTIWTYHPVSAAASAVWIQVGLGFWLLAAQRGLWSRLGGVASVAWGLVVWAFGESFGGIFAPGLTWLFGAPGAVLLYCAAGVLIALPEAYWATPRLGRIVLRVLGGFFVGMAVLQAWPGRGFWQGQAHRSATTGTLTSMVQGMAHTPQPAALQSWVSSFASFDAAHGWAVNLFVVVALLAIGAAFLSARPRLVKPGVIAGLVLCLADWVLIEDFGFFGGVGTDPNSMIPMALLFVAGYVAITKLPAPVAAPQPVPVLEAVTAQPLLVRATANPTYAFRTVAALAGLAIVLVGAAPMAVDSAKPNADPILARATDGPPTPTDTPAPPISLQNQDGQAVSLAGLRGKAIALTFLDPVCTSDCPVIAQEFKSADKLLGSDAKNVVFMAVDANPIYLKQEFLVAFDRQEGLEELANWQYLTGTLPQLEQVWRSYAFEVDVESGGAMIDHSDLAYVIDPSGHTRFALNADPGPATDATASSFAVTLDSALKSALRAR